MNMQQNAKVKKNLDHNRRIGKIILIFLRVPVKEEREKKSQKALITRRFALHKDIFLIETVWISGMF